MTITGDLLNALHSVCLAIYAGFMDLGQLFVNGTMYTLTNRIVVAFEKLSFGNEFDMLNPIAWGTSFLRLLNDNLFYGSALGSLSPIVFFLSNFVVFALGLKFLKLLK